MLTLTVVKPEEAEALLAFYNSIKDTPNTAWNEGYPSMEDVQMDLSREATLVYKEQGRIVGAISTEEDEVLLTDCIIDRSLRSVCITRVGVARDHQGQGLAKALVSALLPILKAQGIEAARLLVSDHNPAAMKTYAACGFTIVGECDLYGEHFLCEEKIL